MPEVSNELGIRKFGLALASLLTSYTVGVGTVMYIQGSVEQTNTTVFVDNNDSTVVNTGANLRIGSGSVTLYEARYPMIVPCVSTGGLTYNTCNFTSPYSATGFVTRVVYQNTTLHRGSTQMDLVLVKKLTAEATAGSGGITLMNNFRSYTGSTMNWGSGNIIGVGDQLRVTTMGTIEETANAHSGKLYIWIERLPDME